MLKNHPKVHHCIVTVGVTTAAGLSLTAPHLYVEAVAIAFVANLIWIWGDMI